MPVKLTKTDLPQLLVWLEQHLPVSFKIYGELKGHLKGQFPDMDFFVDKWPEPQAAVAQVDPDGQELICHTMVKNNVMGIYGVNDQALRLLLNDPSVVDWNTTTVFGGVSSSLQSVLMSVAEDKNRSITSNPSHLMKATREDCKPLPVPEGLKFRAISSDDDIQTVNSTWPFACPGSETYIQHLVRNCPSVFLVTDSGRHVGHMLITQYGSMGMLYVQPEFRRKGYAKVIISQLAQRFFDQGEDVYVIVEERNPVSRSLFESMGFSLIENVAWMTSMPKGCCRKAEKKCCV